MKIQSIFSTCLACYLTSLFWACAQTVSAPEESSDKDEISQEDDADEEEFSGEVTAPPLKEPNVKKDNSSEAKNFF